MYMCVYIYMPITSFDGPLLGLKKSRRRGKDEKLRQEKAKMRKKTKHWNVKNPHTWCGGFSGSFFTINPGKFWNVDLFLAHWLRLYIYIYIMAFFETLLFDVFQKPQVFYSIFRDTQLTRAKWATAKTLSSYTFDNRGLLKQRFVATLTNKKQMSWQKHLFFSSWSSLWILLIFVYFGMFVRSFLWGVWCVSMVTKNPKVSKNTIFIVF